MRRHAWRGCVPPGSDPRLVGRLSGALDRRALPSGDEIVSLRVVVARPGGGRDTLPVQFGPAPDGTRIEVVGAVRRRWWGGPDGRRSRIEVLGEIVRPAADPSR